METAVERLAQYQKDNDIIKQHASWGSEGFLMSEEDKAEVLLNMYKKVEMDLANTVEIPVSQLKAIVESLQKVSVLGRIDFRERDTLSEEVESLKNEINSAVGMSLLLASQWLPRE